VATKSKAIRIFANDDVAIEQVAGLLRRSRADVVHDALLEYLANHRDELTRVFEETQKALATGDLEHLATISVPARRAEADAMMADITAIEQTRE
jgi:hypothetical protein